MSEQKLIVEVILADEPDPNDPRHAVDFWKRLTLWLKDSLRARGLRAVAVRPLAPVERIDDTP